MITIGVDFHKRTSTYHVLNESGETLKKCKLVNERQGIQEFIKSIEGPKRLAMEASRHWGLYHDTVKELVDEFMLGHPKKMRAITQSETKHDAQDAQWIAQLAKSGFLPQAYASNSEIRQLRSLLRFRHFLVRRRASMRHQVQVLLDRNLFANERPGSFKDVFCKRGRLWLSQLKLPERERVILDECLLTFDQLTVQIQAMQRYLATQTLSLAGQQFLRTVPGFRLSQVHLWTVLLEIADIHRFRRAKGLAYYAGLVPQEHSSGDMRRTGRLVKGANMYLRTALIESALAAARSDKGLKAYYQSVKNNAGSGAAIIATARKLAYAIFYVLKEQRNYRPEPLRHGISTPPAATCLTRSALTQA